MLEGVPGSGPRQEAILAGRLGDHLPGTLVRFVSFSDGLAWSLLALLRF